MRGSGEQATEASVPVVGEQLVGGIARDGEILCRSGRFVERDETIDDLGKVMGEGDVTCGGRAVLMPAAMPFAFAVAQFCDEEVAECDRSIAPFHVIHRKCCFRERREHHRVPLGDHLVVETRSSTLRSCDEELLARRFDVVWSIESSAGMHPVGDRSALEVSRVGDAEPGAGILGEFWLEMVVHLAWSPRVVQPLVAVSGVVE